MRGAPVLWQESVADYGIIPADAGSTPDMHENSLEPTDHPRGCGEHS